MYIYYIYKHVATLNSAPLNAKYLQIVKKKKPVWKVNNN